ncbi:hypothetical protein [Blastococcus brunescens]|uniref:Uncharacterized protein n=1 Tax=Blastococcus brunescens TaxID=1564165 RepID=A0ABZ1B768_9ACTN|nr:hypothetical protein [Blastococcus sp. BMG 8361]WRL66654.1 hypothetical protein U6N30_15425 [Blastococcus sp. BMG 8361]
MAGDSRGGGARAAIVARLRGSLWPVPVLGIVIAIGLGVGLPALDEMLASRPDGHPLFFAFGAARRLPVTCWPRSRARSSR